MIKVDDLLIFKGLGAADMIAPRLRIVPPGPVGGYGQSTDWNFGQWRTELAAIKTCA